MKRIAMVAMLAASPAWAEVGQVVQAEGGLILRGSETIVAEEGTPVEEGDLLQTTPTGLIHVLMTDETKFVVGPGTSISIDTALVGSDDGTFESLAVGMTGGLLRMISGNSASEAYRVNTPSATMGIRGTAFDNCVVRDDLLVVHQGIVQSCLRNPVTGEADPASCVDTPAEENSCRVVAAVVDPDGEGAIGQADNSAILQCRLSYQQDELGVREDFQIDDFACREAAEAARQGTQPEGGPGNEGTPAEEGEDETLNTVPEGGGTQTAETERQTSSATSFLTRNTGGGSPDLCSKTDLLAELEERAEIFEELIDEAEGNDEVVFSYRAALRTLKAAIRDVEQTPLVGDECETLEATLATACKRAASPARLEDRCIIDVPNRGF